jgi:uncharacterized cupredoxin-like copper-binding protein
MNRIRIVLVVAAASVLVTLAFASLASGRSDSTKATAVTVKMKEFKFILSRTSVPHGKVTFKLVNIGHIAHDMRIGGKTSAKIQPGKTGTFVVTLKKGRAPYLCPIPGHAAAGMKGVLKVT